MALEDYTGDYSPLWAVHVTAPPNLDCVRVTVGLRDKNSTSAENSSISYLLRECAYFRTLSSSLSAQQMSFRSESTMKLPSEVLLSSLSVRALSAYWNRQQKVTSALRCSTRDRFSRYVPAVRQRDRRLFKKLANHSCHRLGGDHRKLFRRCAVPFESSFRGMCRQTPEYGSAGIVCERTCSF